MDVLILLVLVLLVGALVLFLLRIFKRDARNMQLPQEERVFLASALPEVQDPETELSVLKEYLAMENPHDHLFFARLQVLRALSQNPSLPVELQAAALNRVSQEESAAMLNKSLRKMSRRGGGFIGFSTDL